MNIRNSRASAINITLPWRGSFPLPDGEIDLENRYQLVGLYAPLPFLVVTTDGNVAGPEENGNVAGPEEEGSTMAGLPDAVRGGKRPSPLITWTGMDLTNATLSGQIEDQYESARAITGALTVVTPASGVFRWDYSTADVAENGVFTVQFSATFGSNPTPAKTFRQRWYVQPGIGSG